MKRNEEERIYIPPRKADIPAMTDALPKGLIVRTEGTNSNIESLNGVDLADIAQLWRGTDRVFIV